MQDIKHIGLFISAPSDVSAELNSIRIIVDEINKTSGRQNNYHIESLNWVVDTYTQAGEDAQAVINQQMDGKYDILVAIFWQRLGSPTKRDKSGTVEEINRAVANGKQFLIYFNSQPPSNIYEIDPQQLLALKDFKVELSSRGILYKEFDSVEAFESLFRIHLNNLVSEQLISSGKEVAAKSFDDKYSTITELIEHVEEKDELEDLNSNVFALVEQLTSNMQSIETSITAMTIATEDLTQKLGKRTNELLKYAKIRDHRLRIQKLNIITDLLAVELVDFNDRINNELPKFSENLLPVGPTFSEVAQFASRYHIHEIKDARQSLEGFRDSIESTMQTSAGVLQQVLQWPPASQKFNKAKRDTEVVLKNITKEFLQGLRLINESLESVDR
jgi:hypothetical protein